MSHECSRVDSFERYDVPAFEIRFETLFSAPVGSDTACFTNDKPFDPRACRFGVALVDAVVADEWIRHADDLAGVGRIGENFLVTRHRGIEDNFAADFTLSGPRPATKRTTVFKC